MIPAAKTPKHIIGKATFLFIPRTVATIAPVHAPVPGRGIATKTNSPNAAYFSIVF